MTDAELIALAVEMRAAQNEFYRGGRKLTAYRKARDLERRFDRAVVEREEDRRGRTNTLF